MVSEIRPANISPLCLEEMITKTSSQWLALPSFDNVPFVRKNNRITTKLKSQIRPIAASNIEQWCTPESAMRVVGDFSYLSDESITGCIYLISNVRSPVFGKIGEGLGGMITFVTQVLETIHVAELRTPRDNVITGFWKDLDTCTAKEPLACLTPGFQRHEHRRRSRNGK